MRASGQDLDLALVERLAWGITAAGAALLSVAADAATAFSFLAGALTSTVSFLFLKRGLLKVARQPDSGAKTRFMTGYYLKISLIGVILFLLIRSKAVNTFYLLAGLATVFAAICCAVIVPLAAGGKNSREG
jgi:hypothetical protein